MNVPAFSANLYAQVEAAILDDVRSRRVAVGDRLPSEGELSQRFGVSRTTVRKAIENLVDHGLVEIRRGKGTYVSEPKIRHDLTELSGFVEDMQAAGRNPTAVLLGKEIVAADKCVAEHLKLGVGANVFRIERVRMADGIPVSFDETYLPLDIGEKIVTNDLEAEPIFSLLEEKYELPLVEAEYQLEAISADARVAHALGVSVHSPIFLIERTSFCVGPRPIDYERLYYRGDKVRFVTRLARRPKAAHAVQGD